MHMDTNFTAKEKILVHLLDYYGKNESYALPVAITQEGIAEKVGLKQNTVSYAVRNLVKEGMVEEETRRIKNKKQKRKAYFLTEEGVDEAENVREKLADAQVEVELNGKRKKVRVGELNAYLNTNLSFTEILKRVEKEGRIKQEGIEGARPVKTHYHHMPEAPDVELPEVEELSSWYDNGSDRTANTACVMGKDGSGKTTVLTELANRMEGKTNIFYFKVERWQSQLHFWINLARFLEQTGRYRLSSHIHTPDQIEKNEMITNLKKDLEAVPSLFLIDDVHLNEDIRLVLRDLSGAKGLDSLRLVVSADESLEVDGWSFGEEECLNLSRKNHLKESLNNFYGYIEESDPVGSVVKNHITPEEFEVLAFLSILRKPVRKKGLYRLDSVNENIVNSLLNTPLLELTVEMKPIIHPVVRDVAQDLLDDDKARDLHKIAYQHYLDNPLSEEFDRVEELYHIVKTADIELFEKRIGKTGERILSSGFTDALFEIIRYYKEEVEERKDHEIPYFIGFLEAEIYRRKDEPDSAVERYREVLDHTDDLSVKIKAHHGIAGIKERKGKNYEAISEYQQAIAAYGDTTQDLENKELLGVSRIRLGSLLNEKGDYQKAKENLNEAIKVLGEEHHSLLTSAYFMLARIEKSEGNWKEAVDHFDSGLEHWEEINETYQRIGNLKEIGALYTIMRELDDAEEHLKEAVETSEKFGYWRLKSSALLSLTECYIERRMFDKAIEVAKEAKKLLNELGYEKEKALVHSLLGKAYNMNSQEEEAEKELTKAISIYQRLGSSYRLGLAYFSMAKLQEKVGNKEGIAKNYRKAILSFSGSGANWMAEKLEKEMDNIPISM
ncbi:MAG: tetratricopeptide repeat protein [Candidatus Aenigmatarchaeota archaeon]